MKKGSSFVKKYLSDKRGKKFTTKINIVNECCGACAGNDNTAENVEILKEIFALITDLFFGEKPVEILIQHPGYGVMKEENDRKQ